MNKRAYKRYFLNYNGIMTSENEEIRRVLYTVIDRACSNDVLKPYEQLEAAIRYGLYHGLIEMGGIVDGYYPIYFTEKGFVEIMRLKETTCIFSGRRVRG